MNKANRIVIFILCIFLVTPATIVASLSDEQMVASNELDLKIYGSEHKTSKLTFGYFTENAGQWNSELAFISTTPFGHVGIGYGCVYFNFEDVEFDLDHENLEINGYVVKLIFENSNPTWPFGVDSIQHKSNYFYGNDPETWVAGVSSYRSVLYENLWPGIDLRYYYNDDGLKYDFILHPGADPDNVRIQVEGANSLEFLEDKMVIDTPGEHSIQDLDLKVFYGDSEKQIIDAEFKSVNKNTYSFSLDNYDNTREVVIDPVLYSTYVSGSGWEHARAIEYDSSGNAYVTGFTMSSDFPTTSGVYDTTQNGNTDIYVTKINAAGTALVFSTFVGGSSSDYGYGIALNSLKHVFVTGGTSSNNFPTAGMSYDSTHNGQYDAFLFKLNSQGTILLYSTYIGGTGYDMARGLRIDSSENLYFAGNTSSSNFPTTFGAYDRSYGGVSDVFVCKFSTAGNSSLKYSTFIGGTSGDKAYAIDIDSSGNAYITGYSDNFGSLTYPTTAGAYDTTGGLLEEVIVSKLNTAGNSLLYSTVVASSSIERGYAIDVDSSGYIYVGGWTRSTGFPTTAGAYQTTYKGTTSYSEGYIFKLNISFDKLIYSTFLGDTHNDEINGIDVDSNGNAYVVGSTGSTNFPVSNDAENKTHSGGILDLFFTKLNSAGNGLLYSTFRGGSSTDYGYAVANDDSSGNIYIAGVSASTDFPTTSGAFSRKHKGSDDGIVFKMSFGKPIPAPNNLKAVLGSGSVDLTWNSPAMPVTITGYNIYRGTTPGGGSLLKSIGNTTSYKDNTINSGQDYYYYVTTVTPKGESAASNEVLATDSKRPMFLADNTFQTATTGDQFTFSVDVMDNLLVSSVYVEYWYEEDGMANTSMSNTESSSWELEITIPDVLNILHYVLHANDSFDNWNQSAQVDVPVFDNDKTVFNIDGLPDAGTTGESITFTVDVTDNIAVDTVWMEYWFGSENHVNHSMVKSAGSQWNNEVTIPIDSIDELHYLFHSNDTSDNWNNTGIMDIPILDNDLPVFLSEFTSMETNTGDSFTFSIGVEDNIELTGVWVEYWYGTGTHNNQSMTKDQDNTWKLSIEIMNTTDKLHYIFHAVDTSSNWNETDQVDLFLKDNDKPVIVLDNSPTSANTGEYYTFMVEITDNIGVYEASVKYWFGDGEYSTDTLLYLDGGYSATISVPTDSLDVLHYEITTFDVSANYEVSSVKDVEIIDTISPIIKQISNLKINSGESIDITADHDDNIGVTEVIWTGVPITAENAKLKGIVNTPGVYEITVTVKDLAGNSASTNFKLTVLEGNSKSDSDSDGMPDSFEEKYGLNPNSNEDANIDKDLDELTNLEEYQMGTDPSKSDTDTDGMPDGWEIRYELDPVTPSAEIDTDGDGITDLAEYKAGTNPTKKETYGNSAGSGFDLSLFVILGIVIVVVILSVLLGLMFLKKRKGDGQPSYPQYPEQQQIQPPPPQQQPQAQVQAPQEQFYTQSEPDYIPIQPPPYGQQEQYSTVPPEQTYQASQPEVRSEYIPPHQVPGFVPQEVYPNTDSLVPESKGSPEIAYNNSNPYSYE
jgi:hypothetical protein